MGTMFHKDLSPEKERERELQQKIDEVGFKETC
jgi:hypothetical protein